jgi:hypothetical protein
LKNRGLIIIFLKKSIQIQWTVSGPIRNVIDGLTWAKNEVRQNPCQMAERKTKQNKSKRIITYNVIATPYNISLWPSTCQLSISSCMLLLNYFAAFAWFLGGKGKYTISEWMNKHKHSMIKYVTIISYILSVVNTRKKFVF